MRVERLRLTDFRNYTELDLPLPGGLVVFSGRNAQGKSNILEAVDLIATSRSFRTSADREVVRWHAPGHFARLTATVARRADALDVELVIADPLAGSPAGSPAGAAMPPGGVPFRKRIRVNGVSRRAMDLLGQVTVVVFAPTHLDLVTGPPSERRRFLDLTLCQVHPPYCRALAQYQRVVAQRAALLRRIREGDEQLEALGYWDDQLARLAVPIIQARASFIARAEAPAARLYATLARADASDASRGDASRGDAAAGAVSGESDGATPGVEAPTAPLRLVYQPSFAEPLDAAPDQLAARMLARLRDLRRRELAQGANVLGPHRDDLLFLAGDINLATYGSRGQQRSVALALKLAELAYIEAETGDQPILLLDDVLSELDAQRRADLLTAVRDLDQVLLTVTDASSLPDVARARAHQYVVRGGRVMAEASGEPGS